jgi:adenine nucleotide transporter 17
LKHQPEKQNLFFSFILMSDNLVHALSGAGGGMVAMALTYPLITVSTRSQVDGGKKINQFVAARRILEAEGVEGLYSGLKSAMFGISITSAIYYYFYELVKSGLEAKLAAGEALTVVENMVTGAVAGTITSLCTNPIWVVNTRLLVKDGDDKGKKIGMKQAAQKIIKEEGLIGFWRGIIPALALVSNPVIQYTVFEKLKQQIEKTKKNLSALDFFFLGASKIILISLKTMCNINHVSLYCGQI